MIEFGLKYWLKAPVTSVGPFLNPAGAPVITKNARIEQNSKSIGYNELTYSGYVFLM